MHGLRRWANTDSSEFNLTWPLVKRVYKYARPYSSRLAGILLIILATSGLHLLNPLIMRELIDRTIPAGDTRRVILLAVALLVMALLNSGLHVVQRWLLSGGWRGGHP